MSSYSIGIDIGSTTLKAVLIKKTSQQQVLLETYQRHQTRVKECLRDCLKAVEEKVREAKKTEPQQQGEPSGEAASPDDTKVFICLTGSVGMGIAERWSLPFLQEVVAATHYIKVYHPDTSNPSDPNIPKASPNSSKTHYPNGSGPSSSPISTLIDIGGEDAKMIFFEHGEPTDLRMNGNCAGGTGAFIDQMAALLNVTPEELGTMAEGSKRLYPIASRCGVFCKTDIQNLIARNAARADIAASIFHAVAVQTVTTLAHGHPINAPLLLCGGPLTFIPALRTAFASYLQLPAESLILPPKAHLIPAWGAALAAGGAPISLSELMRRLDEQPDMKADPRQPISTPTDNHAPSPSSSPLLPLFKNREEHAAWSERLARCSLKRGTMPEGTVTAFLGVDSGSTTTKLVVLDTRGRMLFSHYRNNHGDPIKAVEEALRELSAECSRRGTTLVFAGSCSTGYGEDLVKAAFSLHTGIVETMAHYLAARSIEPRVSFVLDIGGQDMKAMFVDKSINRIEVNEACSSGCGSFISTFAQSLGLTVQAFAEAACYADAPCDLGTRCTVFMNSKVKQVLREGRPTADIAAGLAYSVVRNCLYKVLRLKDIDTLGDHIVVQGGTMRNDSVVRALERLTGKQVLRCDAPELMGALGCALHAMQTAEKARPGAQDAATEQAAEPLTLGQMTAKAACTTSLLHCHGCENRCAIMRYRFDNANVYFSGNRCEKIFSNSGARSLDTPDRRRAINVYEEKRRLLFDRRQEVPKPLLTIGLPRCLNMYEEYPFWHTLFSECGLRVLLSEASSLPHYERCASLVMSDNICFPAKLAHSHIRDLQQRGVDRIFMPFVVHEKPASGTQNSYNCPIVTGYSQVVRSVQSGGVPIDSPTVSFKERTALQRQCEEYLCALGVPRRTVGRAVRKAWEAQTTYEQELVRLNEEALKEARSEGRLIIMLAGRPYHTDPLIQHKVSDMIAAQGACVLTDDLVRREAMEMTDVHYLAQWAYPNRIMRAARWTARQPGDVQYMQLTSFGCGPDAFIMDEVQALLRRSGKNLTMLKIDDVDNIGSLKLRVRSLIESLRSNAEPKASGRQMPADAGQLPPFTRDNAGWKIIVPFFTPFISPVIPPLMALAGYDVDNLPMSDQLSSEWGLKYSNNEVCYPATLVVGDIIKAFKSGAYDPRHTCVAMVQTGGQCRASNYLPLIRKALLEAGYTQTPVVSVSLGSGISNYQPGFRVSWRRLLPITLATLLYTDTIARFYYASVVREKHPGAADQLRQRYLDAARRAIAHRRTDELFSYLSQAARDFDSICLDRTCPRVGIVGEIFLKYHPFAQKHVTEWLVMQGVEVVYPALTDFFFQSFVNALSKKETHLGHRFLPRQLISAIYNKVRARVEQANECGRRFRYFVPFDDIFTKAQLASDAITLSAQFGEGWLIAGEVGSLAKEGVRHVVSLQPFGCIANHIVARGIENRLKMLYPRLNLLSLDFDSSVSDVNITNRLLMFINNL